MNRRRTIAAAPSIALLIVCLALGGGVTRALADSTVVFNEIMYHPATSEAQLEWLELHNQMAVDMDISGWYLGDGVLYTFPPGTIIPGGGHVVVAISPAALEAATGHAGALGPFTGRLDNSGERLELYNNSSRLMDSIRYRDEDEWPVAPDGSGVSLAKIDPDTASEFAENWAPSREVGGTPGARNFPRREGGVDLPAGVVSYWSFDGSGTTARDLADGNDGLLSSGATRVAGIVGSGAISFDNTSDAFISVGPGRDNNFSTTTGITIEALIRPQWSAALLDADDIFRKEDGLNRIVLALQHDDNAADRDVAIQPAQQPVLSFGINVGGAYSELDMPLDGEEGRPSLAELLDGEAHHVAATYDSASGRKAIYFDGALAFSVDLPAGGFIASGGASTAYIGNMSGRREPFSGVIDELVFWNRALAAGTVASHHEAFLAGVDYFAAGDSPESVRLAFNETFTSVSSESWVEIVNHGETEVRLRSLAIVSGGVGAGEFVFPEQTLAPGEYLVLTDAQLGFDLVSQNKLFLFPASRAMVIDAVELKDDLRGRFPEATGPWLYPRAPTPEAANEFSFHDEVVINEVMYHPRPLSELPPTIEETILVEIDAVWRYDDSGDDLGTAWRQIGFDDAAWPSGAALLYHETSDLPAPKNTPLELGAITYYFRSRFDYDGDLATADIQARLVVDDGAVVYLNGVEVLRRNMPAGPVDATTEARPGVGNADFTGPFPIPTDALALGSNLLAVEVHQSTPTSSDVVFGLELFSRVVTAEGRPFGEPPAAYLELHNRSGESVELSGWRLDGGIDFIFENGTTLAAGGYLVVAEDRNYLRALYPAAPIVGNFTRRLSRSSDLLVLKDDIGNPVDSLRYYDYAPWPDHADGGGPSIELRDPFADNARPEAWASSDEGARSQWRSYSYEEVATANIGPTQWNEFVIGLLDAGELLLDDIHVIEDPAGAAVELIQNPTFETGASAWRLLGTHGHSRVITDPDDPSNRVLHLVATGPTEHMHNHLETTLRGGETVNNGRTYRVSFRARWLGGSSQLNTRLYFNRAPETTLIEVPAGGGTPGAANSRLVENIGPTFEELRHEPPVPAPGEEVEVSVRPDDPDGVEACTLWWSVNGGAWSSSPMDIEGDGLYRATVAGQESGRVVQFYVEARDARGAVATAPAAGRDSRALYRVDDGQADLADKHNLRIVMTPADTSFLHEPTNVMSNDRLGGTAIYDEREVYYDVGVRLKGSERGRNQVARVGFNVRYPSDHLFRGVHRTTAIDRSGGWAFGSRYGQDEILIKHMIQHAGDIPGMYDDLIRVIAPRSVHTGTALLQMARYRDVFLDSQWENGGDGTVFEYELIYYPTTTNTGTPEGLKLPEPDRVLGTDIRDLGDDKEVYRWNFIIHNNEDRDDYSRLIDLCKTFSLSGSVLEERAAEVMDVDEWMRTFAMMSLCGVGDAYTQGNNHNIRMYVRPSDEKVLVFPWDWDFAFVQSTSAALWGNQNLAKITTRPPYLHLYYGHLLDIIQSTYNTTYMSHWTDHYGDLAGRSYATLLGYIGQRASFVTSRLPASVPFSITTNGGADFTVDEGTVTLAGRGWIDVTSVLLVERDEVLDVYWSGVTEWQATIQLVPGANSLELLAFDRGGSFIDSDGIVVTSTYDPPDPTLSSLSPSEGFPGDEVTLVGTGLLPGLEVIFGELPSDVVRWLDVDRATAVIPRVAPGEVAVTVRNVDGGTSASLPFNVLELLPMFIRGDFNLDGAVDISDAVRILLYLFGGVPGECLEAADADDSGAVNLTDAVFVLDFLFRGGPPPPAPFPEPAEDRGGPDSLGCERGL